MGCAERAKEHFDRNNALAVAQNIMATMGMVPFKDQVDQAINDWPLEKKLDFARLFSNMIADYRIKKVMEHRKLRPLTIIRLLCKKIKELNGENMMVVKDEAGNYRSMSAKEHKYIDGVYELIEVI